MRAAFGQANFFLNMFALVLLPMSIFMTVYEVSPFFVSLLGFFVNGE